MVQTIKITNYVDPEIVSNKKKGKKSVETMAIEEGDNEQRTMFAKIEGEHIINARGQTSKGWHQTLTKGASTKKGGNDKTMGGRATTNRRTLMLNSRVTARHGMEC